MPIKVVPLGVWGLCSVHWWALQWDPSLIWVIPFLGQDPAFTLQHPAELGLIMVLLAEHWLPGAIGVGVMEGGTMAWEVSGVCH